MNDEELLTYSRQIAGILWRRWPTLDPDDIASEICLYILSTPSVLAEWHDYMEGSYEDEEAEKYASRRMRMIARRAGARYCRREIAAQLGYKPEDEAFYSIRQLGELVEHYYSQGITERPPVGRGESVTRSVSDPAAGGGWLVSLLDVDRGLREMPQKYRARLKFRFKDLGQYSNKEIVAMVGNLAVAPGKRKRIEKHLGDTEKSISTRVQRALRRLQEVLGGASPYVPDGEPATAAA
jgi:hypothetical protein